MEKRIWCNWFWLPLPFVRINNWAWNSLFWLSRPDDGWIFCPCGLVTIVWMSVSGSWVTCDMMSADGHLGVTHLSQDAGCSCCPHRRTGDTEESSLICVIRFHSTLVIRLVKCHISHSYWGGGYADNMKSLILKQETIRIRLWSDEGFYFAVIYLSRYQRQKAAFPSDQATR